MRIHSIIPCSLINGPGKRFIIWFQGCIFNCPECFNPQTHDVHGGYELALDDLIMQISNNLDNIDGITISGGEPFLQNKELKKLLIAIKTNFKLPIVIFTGYTEEELRHDETKVECLSFIDVLIAGRYMAELKCDNRFASTLNQKVLFLSDKYSAKDFDNSAESEIIIKQDGEIIVSGKINSNRIFTKSPSGVF